MPLSAFYAILAFAKNRDGSSMGLSGFGPSLNANATTLTATSEQLGVGATDPGV